MDVLIRIKRLVIDGAIRYTEKAFDEMAVDGIVPRDVEESILNATRIAKTLRSQAPQGRKRELLYVIKSANYEGTSIYTKGKIDQEGGKACFYVLISAKLDTDIS